MYSGMPKACIWVWSKRAAVCPKRAPRNVIHSLPEAKAESIEKPGESLTVTRSEHTVFISKEGF
jgi:hypothetical protein